MPNPKDGWPDDLQHSMTNGAEGQRGDTVHMQRQLSSLLESQARVERALKELREDLRANSEPFKELQEDLRTHSEKTKAAPRSALTTEVSPDQHPCELGPERRKSSEALLLNTASTRSSIGSTWSSKADKLVSHNVPCLQPLMTESEASDVTIRVEFEPRDYSYSVCAVRNTSVTVSVANAVKGWHGHQIARRNGALFAKHRASSVFPLHPTSSERVAFDVLIIILICYDSVMVPYSLAWDAQPEGAILIIGWVTTVIWMLDLLLSFLTGFRSADALVMDFRSITKRYVKSWFFPDLLVVVFDVVWLSAIFGKTGMSLKFARFAKVGRFMRILAKFRTGLFKRIEKITSRYAGKIGLASHVQFIAMFMKLAVLIMWLNHIGGCLWYTIGKHSYTDTGRSWQRTLAMEAKRHRRELGGDPGTDEYPHSFMYLTGLYWSATSMFSSSSYMAPSNTEEAIFTQIYIVIGALFVSCFTSSLAAILINGQMAAQERNENLRTLSDYLDQHKIDPLLAMSIRDQAWSRMMAEKRLAHRDVLCLSLVSKKLRGDLSSDLYTSYILRSDFFRACHVMDRAVLRQLCNAVQDRALRPGEEVLMPGKEVEEAYMVLWGTLHYTMTVSSFEHQDTSKFDNKEVVPGSWLCEQTLWIKWQAKGFLESATPCDLITIKQEAFGSLLADFPDLFDFCSEYSKVFASALAAEEPLKLSDLETGLDSDSVMTEISRGFREVLSRDAMASLREMESNRWFKNLRKGMDSLEEEVNEGKCHLNLTLKDGSDQEVILRVVHLAVLRLFRSDGLMCIRIARWSQQDQSLEPAICLPGEKVKAEEEPLVTLKRLIEQDFYPVSEEVEVDVQEVKVEQRHSPNYGLDTKYIRRIYHCLLGPRGDEHPVVDLKSPLRPPTSSPAGRHQTRMLLEKKVSSSRQARLESNSLDFVKESVEQKKWEVFAIREKGATAARAGAMAPSSAIPSSSPSRTFTRGTSFSTGLKRAASKSLDGLMAAIGQEDEEQGPAYCSAPKSGLANKDVQVYAWIPPEELEMLLKNSESVERSNASVAHWLKSVTHSEIDGLSKGGFRRCGPSVTTTELMCL